MQKEEFINLFQKNTANADGDVFSKAECRRALKAFFGTIEDCLVSLSALNDFKTKIRFAGFGDFGVRHNNTRNGVNPRTTEDIVVPEKNVPYFKFSPEMKKKVKR